MRVFSVFAFALVCLIAYAFLPDFQIYLATYGLPTELRVLTSIFCGATWFAVLAILLNLSLSLPQLLYQLS